MLKILIHLFCLLAVFSCAKENDPFKSITFENPIPTDNAKDVIIGTGYLNLQLDIATDDSFLHYPFLNNIIYLDSVNPPLKYFRYFHNRIAFSRSEQLKPNKTYYWALAIESVSGNILSDIYSFTTVGFEGYWKLDTNLLAEEVILDSMLIENEDIVEFQISDKTVKIKLFGSSENKFIDAVYIYDELQGRFTFIENQNNKEHIYYFYSMGYNERFQKVTLEVRNNNCYFIYSRL